MQYLQEAAQRNFFVKQNESAGGLSTAIIVVFWGCQVSIWRKIAVRDLSNGKARSQPDGLDATCMLKATESMMIRLEIVKGKSDIETVYLRFGHAD